MKIQIFVYTLRNFYFSEDAFFSFNIAQKLPECPLVVRRYKNRCLDVEYFCQQAMPLLKRVMSDNYMSHECQDIGCSAKVVVIDGNAKNRRYLQIY